ncbi:HesB/IscA family protein [Jiulongibacter sp. NS-SX5]|uniref:HesB/IscA family protein n=1 Tax=Jiulongibacter sp. NS-SX5 TaxID=3463854 RepID=UPI004059D77F
MISFSKEARKKISDTLQNAGISSEYALRIGLSGGACTGKYVFGFDKPSTNDDLFQVDNIKVVIDKKHLMYLMGRKVTYLTENGESFFGLE